MQQITAFLQGDRYACPLTSWIHYIQLGFIGLIVYVSFFCGSSTGG
jgi:hypothetical protein